MNLKDFKQGIQIPLMESGTYPCVCCGVIDVGTQKTSFNGIEKIKGEFRIVFEFPNELVEIDGEMKPRQLSRRFAKFTNEKSNFGIFMKSWRGRDFSQEELADFDLGNLLGMQGMGCVVHNTSKNNGKSYANLDSVIQPIKGMDAGTPETLRYFVITDKETWPTFAHLPAFMQEEINKSEECKYAPFVVDENGNVSVDHREPNGTLVEDPEADISFEKTEDSVPANELPATPDF